MAANHTASSGCHPPALMWATLATMHRLARTCWSPLHPLHSHHVPKRLLPEGSWHSAPEDVHGVTAHIRVHKMCTQHGQTTPRFGGRSHFQYIFRTALTSTWPTPIKSLVSYMKQTQGTPCFKKQNLPISPSLAQKTPG